MIREGLREAAKAAEPIQPETPAPREEVPEGLYLDLACGQSKREGYQGVDIAGIEGVDHVHDLTKLPWPFEDNSVDGAHCSHFLEHLDGDQQIDFMNELHRVLKPKAECFVICPYGFSPRAWQDPTHKRPIFAECFLYYNAFQREQMKTTHGPYARITADFDADISFHVADEWMKKNPETVLRDSMRGLPLTSIGTMSVPMRASSWTTYRSRACLPGRQARSALPSSRSHRC